MFWKNNTNFLLVKILICCSVFFLFSSDFASAASLGQQDNFYINQDYDSSNREEITAQLRRIGTDAYFYIDTNWWEKLSASEKDDVAESLRILDNEFHNNIYPVLTKTFGKEWKPGIDKDDRVTILFHSMKNNSGGYFRENDQYLKIRVPDSNEKEMVYLNTQFVNSTIEKSFLAHEFVHLITFNQKNRIFGVSEEVWLNEARAELGPTLVGYDDLDEDTNLESRIKVFLKSPGDSIPEWQNKLSDYGALNLFAQYIVDHYGIEVFADSLKSEKTGIESLEAALRKNEFAEGFSRIFTDWTIAVLANDCDLGEKYCYKNQALENMRISPSVNFLPMNGDSNLGVSQSAKNWAGNWYKFIGGSRGLKIRFIGNPENIFKIPYVSKDSLGNLNVGFFELDQTQKGEIVIPEFGEDIKSITIIPSIQSKKSGFEGKERGFSFFWEASTNLSPEEIEKEKDIAEKCLVKSVSEMSRQEIISQIEEIESLLSQLRARLKEFEPEPEPESKPEPEPEPEQDFPEDADCEPKPACRLKGVICCSRFPDNLSLGMRNNDVKCLQQLLEILGTEIYPEGLDTGYFGPLTKAAVIRFQNKFADEILIPWGISEGTGFVGKTTRAKLNELCEL